MLSTNLHQAQQHLSSMYEAMLQHINNQAAREGERAIDRLRATLERFTASVDSLAGDSPAHRLTEILEATAAQLAIVIRSLDRGNMSFKMAYELALNVPETLEESLEMLHRRRWSR